MTNQIFGRHETYLYKLNPKRRKFFTGIVEGDRQAIVGLWFPFLVAVFFNKDGVFLGTEQRRLSPSAERLGSTGFYSQEFQSQFKKELQTWWSGFGFQASQIAIRRFSLPTYDIKIEDFPQFCRDVINNPAVSSQDDITDAQELVQKWDRESLYLFYWGNDFIVNQIGEIVAS